MLEQFGAWVTSACNTDGDSIGRFAAGHDGPEGRAWCAAGHEWVSGIAIEKLPDRGLSSPHARYCLRHRAAGRRRRGATRFDRRCVAR